MERREYVDKLAWRNQPQSVRFAVQISGPFEAGSEPLNRSVDDEFNRSEAQLLGVVADSRKNALRAAFGAPLRRKCGNDPERLGRVVGNVPEVLIAPFREVVHQVGRGCDASQLRDPAEIPDGFLLLAGRNRKSSADQPVNGEHGGELLQFAGRLAIGILADSVNVRFAINTRDRQQRRVDVHQMHAGMEYNDW